MSALLGAFVDCLSVRHGVVQLVLEGSGLMHESLAIQMTDDQIVEAFKDGIDFDRLARRYGRQRVDNAIRAALERKA